MENKDYTKFSDMELLEENKKLKSFSITNGFLVGFLVAIIFYSIYHKSYSIFLLIPLYFIFKLLNDSRLKKIKELKSILKERNIHK